MPYSAVVTAYVACIILLARSLLAAPELTFPVNSQVPFVAYASQYYEYTFSPVTFRSQDPPLTYSIRDAPSWLEIDSDTRTLSGTPSSENLGAVTFELVASDTSGEIASSVTLVTLNESTLGHNQPLLPYLEASGAVSTPATLLTKPSTPFFITFSTNIFSGASDATTYYAICEDSSPLPPWINFNPTTLTFSGSSPPLVSPASTQQKYTISIIATDVAGFAEVRSDFQIAISYHILSFTTASETLSISRGVRFSSQSFREDLVLDNEPISDENLISVTADAPNWMIFDAKQVQLKGVPPDDVDSVTILVQAQDIFSNVANLLLVLNVDNTNTTTHSVILELAAQIGQSFSYDMQAVLFQNLSLSSRVEVGTLPSWLHYSTVDTTLAGYIPASLTPQSFNISFTVTKGFDTRITILRLQVHESPVRSSSVTSSPSAKGTLSSQPKPSGTGDNNTDRKGFSHRINLAIVLSIVLPIAAILVIMCTCCWCSWRKRKRHSSTPSIEDVDDSAPVQAAGEDPASLSQHGTNGGLEEVVQLSTPVQAPRVELPWAPDSLVKSRERLSRKVKPSPRGSFISGWGDLVTAPTSLLANDAVTGSGRPNTFTNTNQSSMRLSVPRRSARRQIPVSKESISVNDADSRRLQARPQTLARPVGLPQRSSTAAGHGSGILSRDSAANRSSWQTTFASIPVTEVRNAAEHIQEPPSVFSARETSDAKTARSEGAERPTLRLVNSSSSNYAEDLEDLRQKWHTERAREKLEGSRRFSSSGSSRMTSLSRLLATTSRSLDRKLSATIPEDSMLDSEINTPSSSKQANRASNTRAWSERPHMVRAISVASSGQFDSAASSDSQWDDEDQRHSSEAGKPANIGIQSSRAAPETITNSQPYGIGDLEQSDHSTKGSSRFI